MTLEQISVFLENKTGSLANITALLGEHGINMKAMSIADTTEFGILRIITTDTAKTVEVLRSADYVLSIAPVIAVAVEDSPSSLAKVLRVLDASGVSIEYIYAFMARKASEAHVVFRVEDNDKAIEVLTNAGMKLLTQAELTEM